MTPAVEEMLIGHEVGHAIFTTNDYIKEGESRALHSYMNVIEDVRIEKKMKERYPGSRKSFNLGYRELNDRDFFGVKDKNLAESLLIDKINLYFKVGFNCGVKFTSAEQDIVLRVDQCKTEEDVVRLAEEIYGFSQDELERRKSGQPKIVDDDEEEEDVEYDGDGEWNDDEIEYDELEEDDSPRKPRSVKGKPNLVDPKEELTEELKAKTLERFDKKLERLADESLRVTYFEPKFEIQSPQVVIPFRTVLNGIRREPDEINRHKLLKFKSTSSPMVNYLIKEFEMKKSASMYKRAKVAKIGQLDSKKLYAYKLKEDLFKSVMQVQEGKKHGMIFLLDWSGSMSNCIEETLEQVINLAMFCQRIQIPYQVFAFTDGYGDRYATDVTVVKNEKGLSSSASFKLLEFYSHKMTNFEFTKMTEYLMNRPWNKNEYGLNGTPLNEALLYMVDYIGKFIKNYDVEKMSLITLTDGEGGQLYSYGKSVKNGPSWEYNTDGKPVRVNRQSILRDPITKKDYDIGGSSNEQTAALLNLLRDRYAVNSVGFYLISNTVRSALAFAKNNTIGLTSSSMSALADRIIYGIRKDKHYVMTNIPGRDELYLLPADVKIQDRELQINSENMNAGQISRELTKIMNMRKTSRVVLSKFIGIVS
jgi:PAS domain-containing protein